MPIISQVGHQTSDDDWSWHDTITRLGSISDSPKLKTVLSNANCCCCESTDSWVTRGATSIGFPRFHALLCVCVCVIDDWPRLKQEQGVHKRDEQLSPSRGLNCHRANLWHQVAIWSPLCSWPETGVNFLRNSLTRNICSI